MTTWYRLVFKNGTHSAWSRDKESIEKDAKFFRARIETMTTKS